MGSSSKGARVPAKAACPHNKEVECGSVNTAACRSCGWCPGVGEQRLKKRFTREQIAMLKKAKIVKEL